MDLTVEHPPPKIISRPPSNVNGKRPARPISIYQNVWNDLIEVDLDNELGKGSYGKVCAGTADNLVNLAIKITNIKDRGKRAVALNEVNKLRELQYNPRVVQFYGFHITGDFMYVDLGRLGQSLKKFLEEKAMEEKPVHFSIVAMIGINICRALEYIHSRALVHMDIKCENFCLTETKNRLVLVDFGSALYRKELVYIGRRIHTVTYQSPQALLGLPIDEKTDIWSGAVILFKAFTRVYPFEGFMPHQVFRSFHHYKRLPLNAPKSRLYKDYMDDDTVECDELDMPVGGDLLDDCRAKRAQLKFLDSHEERLSSMILNMFEPEVSKRPTATDSLVQFMLFWKDIYNVNYPLGDA